MSQTSTPIHSQDGPLPRLKQAGCGVSGLQPRMRHAGPVRREQVVHLALQLVQPGAERHQPRIRAGRARAGNRGGHGREGKGSGAPG